MHIPAPYSRSCSLHHHLPNLKPTKAGALLDLLLACLLASPVPFRSLHRGSGSPVRKCAGADLLACKLASFVRSFVRSLLACRGVSRLSICPESQVAHPPFSTVSPTERLGGAEKERRLGRGAIRVLRERRFFGWEEERLILNWVLTST